MTCILESRWKGHKAVDVNRYKLWYVVSDGRYNGVSILVSYKILKQVIKVKRYNKRVMLVRIVVGEEVKLIIGG